MRVSRPLICWMKLAYTATRVRLVRHSSPSILISLFFAAWNSVRFWSFSMFSIFLILLSPTTRISKEVRVSKFSILRNLFADKYNFRRLINVSKPFISLILLKERSKKTSLLRWPMFSMFRIRLSYNSSSSSCSLLSNPSIFLIKFFRRPRN